MCFRRNNNNNNREHEIESSQARDCGFYGAVQISSPDSEEADEGRWRREITRPATFDGKDFRLIRNGELVEGRARV